jgi:hypothetical protein
MSGLHWGRRSSSQKEVLVAGTIIHHSIEELRGGLRSIESGDVESPDYQKVRDELILAGFVRVDEVVTPAGHRYAA